MPSNSHETNGEPPEHPGNTSKHKRNGSGSRKPPLHRNNACLPCRKKKRKCDAEHPICGPCLASARLYQEEPACEWATSSSRHDDSPAPGSAGRQTSTPLKHEDGDHDSNQQHQQDFPSSSFASDGGGILGVGPPGSTAMNPFIAADPSIFYGSLGNLNTNIGSNNTTDVAGYASSADEKDMASKATSTTSSTSKTANKRKNLKRDNNTVEVDTLQARIADLEAKLQQASAAAAASAAASTSTSSFLPSTDSQSSSALYQNLAPSTSSLYPVAPPMVPSKSSNESLHTTSTHGGHVRFNLLSGSEGGSGAGGSSTRPGTPSSNSHPSARSSRQSSFNPHTGLPTPPSSASVSTNSIFPPSPASNNSLGVTTSKRTGAQDGQSSFGSMNPSNQNMDYINSQQNMNNNSSSNQGQGQYMNPNEKAEFNFGPAPPISSSFYASPPQGQDQQRWSLPFNATQFAPEHSTFGNQASDFSPSNNLLWTGWPTDLPQLDIVKALAGTALAMISDTLFLLPADAVFRSLALPPTDPRFPSIALLHSLCALGATALPIPAEGRGYWQDAPSPSKYHFRQAKKHLQTFNASQVLDDLRAAVLLTIYSFAAEQFIDVWQLVGMACRGLPATGLNHVQNHSALPSTRMGTTPGHFLRKATYLPPPVDDYEVYYRSTTMWMAFSSDVWMGACSGWAMAIDLQDITTLLPVWPSDTSPLDVVLNQPSLDPHSSMFFTTHLDSPMISLHISIKAMVLMRRVVDFLQRSTAPDSVITPEAKRLIRASPAFVSLTDTISAFQQNFPDKAMYHLQVLPSGKLDSNLLNAHIMPCTALMLLYEPFIYDGNDEGFHSGSMAAANRILQITDSVYSHSKDTISFYYTQINYSWMVCNRTLIRAMRFKEDANDHEGAKHLRSQIEFLLARNATLAAQSPLVCSCLGIIENLVKDESAWHLR